MQTPVVISGSREIPLAEVKGRAARLAGGLQRMGLGPGDRYAIVLRNEPAFFEASLAAPIIGAVPVPVNWHWTGQDLRHLLTDSGVKAIIAHTDLLPAVEAQRPEGVPTIEAEVPEEVATAYGLGPVRLTGRYPTLAEQMTGDPPSDPGAGHPLSVIYTSGTTGLPKGILRNPLRPEDAPAVARMMAERFKFDPQGVTLLPAPLYHTAPNAAGLFAAGLGMSMVIMPRFDAEEFLRLIERYRVTTVQVVPTMFIRLLRLPREVRERYDLSSLKAIVHAAAPCPAEVKRATIDWLGPIIYEYYGGSEGGMWVYCDTQEWLDHPGTVGRAIDDGAIRILGPDLEEVPTGETGVIYGRSPSVWPDFTYINNEAKRRAIEAADGFITVGDVGRMDQDGFLYLSDRLNDMIISGGVNIYPAEIEACLHGLAGVADVAVFGIPGGDMGESIAAHVELLPGASLTEEQVRQHVADNLARYKVPSVVVFEEELPREDSGKLFKRRLKEQYWPAPEQA